MKYIISIGLLLLALVYVSIKFINLNNKYLDDQVSFIGQKSVLLDEIDKIKTLQCLEFQNNYNKLKNFTVYDQFKSSYTIYDLTDKKTLILRKTEFGCNDCFGKILEIIKQKLDSISFNLIILFAVDNIRDLKYYIDYYDLKGFHVFYSINMPSPTEIEKTNQNYCFTINQDNIINNFYILDPNNQKRINDYLEMVKRYN